MLVLLRIMGVRRWYGHADSSRWQAAAASQLVFVHWLKIPLPSGCSDSDMLESLQFLIGGFAVAGNAAEPAVLRDRRRRRAR